jgi:hypothetical protein
MAIDRNEMNRRLVMLAESKDVRLWQLGPDELTPAERVFRAVWELESEVNNGGFGQYFWNSSGSLVLHVVGALRLIGASTMAGLVDCAIEVVGRYHPWHDDGARQQSLNDRLPEVFQQLELLNQRFFAYPDDLTSLLYRYVSEHREEIGAAAAF